MSTAACVTLLLFLFKALTVFTPNFSLNLEHTNIHRFTNTTKPPCLENNDDHKPQKTQHNINNTNKVLFKRGLGLDTQRIHCFRSGLLFLLLKGCHIFSWTEPRYKKGFPLRTEINHWCVYSDPCLTVVWGKHQATLAMNPTGKPILIARTTNKQ